MEEREVVGQGTFSTGDQVSGVSRRGTGGAATLLAGLGLGAVAMYFLDPVRGARRRGIVTDKLANLLRRGARDVREASVNARNHAKGVVAESKARLRTDEVPDEVLVERVRSHLGHHVEHARAIQVFAEDGKVVLCGSVPVDEIDRAVRAAESVRGVACVDNQIIPAELRDDGQITADGLTADR